jgi:hypothetical protein
MCCDHEVCKRLDLGECKIIPPTCEICKESVAVGVGIVQYLEHQAMKWLCKLCYVEKCATSFIPLAETNQGKRMASGGKLL